jgi:hypothetical protein
MWQLAELLVEHEACRQDSTAARNVAAGRVFDRLRRPLCMLTGMSGLRVLLLRALALARAQSVGLSVVGVESDASLTGLDRIAIDDNPEGAIVLIAQLLGLLSAFIGEGLTMSILVDAWPDLGSLSPEPAQEANKT